MIRAVSLSDVATFSGRHELEDLAALNIIFGANGVGKTTIARVIARPDEHPSCSIAWDEEPLEALVYTKDFVERNFSPSSTLRGVFTLGEEQVETLDKIESAEAELAANARELRKLTVTLEGDDGAGGLRAQLADDLKVLGDRCWTVKTRHDDVFKSVFQGFRGSRTTFRDKILAERGSAAEERSDLETLRLEVAAAFEEEPTAEYLLTPPDGSELEVIAAHELLAKRIVGRADIPIGELITALGNSDWVQKGLTYLPESDAETCPFCQQALPVGFQQSLEDFFDESYATAIRGLRGLEARHGEAARRLTATLENITSSSPRFLDVDSLSRLTAQVTTTLKLNGERLASKISEPSTPMELESISPALKEIGLLVDDANERADAHNEMVANLEAERDRIRREVWQYLVSVELSEDLKAYDQASSSRRRGINAVQQQIEVLNGKQAEVRRRLDELEKNVTSTRPTVIAMNHLLKSLGFTSFSFEHTADEKSYRLVRSDGSDAAKTLSEGERSFVTFLYFYHLIRGSVSPTGVNTERVVVFDDPVSSLDSDVLFFVAMLIRGLFDEVRRGDGATRQVFVLTHNAYFHREVTFDPRRVGARPRRDESFWVVRRVGSESELERQEQNPVRTAYDLLWEELRSPRPGTATLQNTMRRILENYFKILGGVDPRDVIAQFAGHDQMICRSLVSWANAGSHFAMDDLYVTVDESEDLFRRIFREIFEKSDHGGHYRMMMRTDTGDSASQLQGG